MRKILSQSVPSTNILNQQESVSRMQKDQNFKSLLPVNKNAVLQQEVSSLPSCCEVRCSNSNKHRLVCAKTKSCYEGCIKELNKQIADATQENRQLKKQMFDHKKQPDLALKALNQTFNPDQVEMLLYRKSNPRVWSDETITESLKTRFVCGGKAYEHERKKIPLPSNRQLQRRMEDLNFDCGILDEVIELLKLKLNAMPDHDLDCGIVFDEMSIQEAKKFCLPSKQFYGEITIPGQQGLASHALVFMLIGIRNRWKQVVGYYFTGNSIPDGILQQIVVNVIKRAERIGCKIHFITSDCGPNNKNFWNDMGLRFKKNTVLESGPVCHPADAKRTLEIIPDVVHVFKLGVQGLLKNEVIILPPDVVASNKFYSNEVKLEHLRDLVHFERNNLLKVASKLTQEDAAFENKISTFDAMKVINSEKYVNPNVSAAWRFYSDVANRPDVLPTAFFIECFSKWFRLSKNRTFKLAHSKQNSEVYQQTLDIYNFFKNLMFKIEVGSKRNWKPWQASTILTINSILRLQQYFLNDKQYKFLLTCHFTQDCVQNVVSQIRLRQKRPTALQFKSLLKRLSISQYMTEISGSSYDPDERDWLLNFPSNVKELKRQRIQEKENTEKAITVQNDLVPLHKHTFSIRLNDSESNVVYHIAGMVIHKIAIRGSVCVCCINDCIAKKPFLASFNKFTILIDFTGQTFVYVNENTFKYFVRLEIVFRQTINEAEHDKGSIFEKLLHIFNTVHVSHLSSCNNIKEKNYQEVSVFSAQGV
ncbi:uncharacterized protein LOC131675796 [Topomyia yanbarensis]|uniref:uncharacterized protein LOC131675796 n=1 Tax=Topomyia yanbarensis TaxID=2498891 RepID=UPI00273C9A62|nr:uncharacterized protein LOC131675796 [Topomyia yanbarensis]